MTEPRIGFAVVRRRGKVAVAAVTADAAAAQIVADGHAHDAVLLDPAQAIDMARALMRAAGWTGLLAPMKDVGP